MKYYFNTIYFIKNNGYDLFSIFLPYFAFILTCPILSCALFLVFNGGYKNDNNHCIGLKNFYPAKKGDTKGKAWQLYCLKLARNLGYKIFYFLERSFLCQQQKHHNHLQPFIF